VNHKPHKADKHALSPREWKELLCHLESMVAGLAPADQVLDLVAQAACALVARSRRKPPIRSWKAYAARVAHNTCKAWLAASSRDPDFVPPAFLETQEDNETSTAAEARPRKLGSHVPRDQLDAFSQSLRVRERTVFDRYFRQNLPVKHIARRLSLTPLQVRRSIKRILRCAAAFWRNLPGS
jgi:RNA polymerase sigma factor (sigma-70 family)